MVTHTDYEAVAAGQTAQVLGPVGKAGDIIERLIVKPATESPGAVTIIDGTGGSAVSTVVYTGGATSIDDLKPLVIELGIRSRVGAWQITTGADVSVLAIGRFT